MWVVPGGPKISNSFVTPASPAFIISPMFIYLFMTRRNREEYSPPNPLILSIVVWVKKMARVFLQFREVWIALRMLFSPALKIYFESVKVMTMEGSVSDERGVRTDVDQSIWDTEEKYRKSREGTPSLRKELWISATSLMNKNIHSKSHDILIWVICIGPAFTFLYIIL